MSKRVRLRELDEPDYQVGYKRPPVATRFKPGQSGNRAGRPKGSGNVSTALERELNATITVTEHGKTRKLRKREAFAKQLTNKALSGDPKAMSLVMAHDRGSQVAVPTMPAPERPLDADERAVMAALLERMQAHLAQHPQPNNTDDDDLSEPQPRRTRVRFREE